MFDNYRHEHEIQVRASALSRRLDLVRKVHPIPAGAPAGGLRGGLALLLRRTADRIDSNSPAAVLRTS